MARNTGIGYVKSRDRRQVGGDVMCPPHPPPILLLSTSGVLMGRALVGRVPVTIKGKRRRSVGKNMMGFEEMGRGAMGWDGARQSGVGKDQMGWSRKGRDVSGHDSKR